MNNAALVAKGPSICPRPTPCRNSSASTHRCFRRHSRSISEMMAIPPPNPIVPIFKNRSAIQPRLGRSDDRSSVAREGSSGLGPPSATHDPWLVSTGGFTLSNYHQDLLAHIAVIQKGHLGHRNQSRQCERLTRPKFFALEHENSVIRDQGKHSFSIGLIQYRNALFSVAFLQNISTEKQTYETQNLCRNCAHRPAAKRLAHDIISSKRDRPRPLWRWLWRTANDRTRTRSPAGGLPGQKWRSLSERWLAHKLSSLGRNRGKRVGQGTARWDRATQRK